jgi:uncharacterized Fe-S center protein
MSSEVYFAGLRSRSPGENRCEKVVRLFDEAGFAEIIGEDDLTAIKLHFGERGNTTYLHPVYVRQVVDRVRKQGAHPFLTDTNTLYFGSRHNAVTHLKTAISHGFGFSVTGAPLIIADGLFGDNYVEFPLNQRHFDQVKIAGDIAAARSMIVMSHFKGHSLAGFGGAIKNLAMGCAPVLGKLDQHAGLQPLVDDAVCIGCGECATICPRSAISRDTEASQVIPESCIGCGDCVTVCPTAALQFNWERDVPVFIEMLTEYALGTALQKNGRCGYFNFLMDITPDCDCVPWSDAPIVPDIGILASRDPVAIDCASMDLVNLQGGLQNSILACNHQPGGDKFSGTWDYTRGARQIEYGTEIGLGTSTYTLIEIV